MGLASNIAVKDKVHPRVGHKNPEGFRGILTYLLHGAESFLRS
jgi:hypothetical protein